MPVRTDDRSRLGFLATASYLAQPVAPQPFLVDRVLPVGGAMNFYGAPKNGKSYVALQLAAAISGDKPAWLGYPVRQQGRVAYVQIDTPRDAWMDRLREFQQAGYSMREVHSADRLMLPYPFNILTTAHLDWLKQALSTINPVAVVIDTLRESFAGNENDSAVMQSVVSRLVSACGTAALVLVSHSRKSNPLIGESLMEDARGSSYVAGRMDTVCRVEKAELRLGGRQLPDTTLTVRRANPFLAYRDPSDLTDEECLKVINEAPEATQQAWARTLADWLDTDNVEACRARLRRYLEGKKKPVPAR